MIRNMFFLTDFEILTETRSRATSTARAAAAGCPPWPRGAAAWSRAARRRTAPASSTSATTAAVSARAAACARPARRATPQTHGARCCRRATAAPARRRLTVRDVTSTDETRGCRVSPHPTPSPPTFSLWAHQEARSQGPEDRRRRRNNPN